jgi:hypothetical protein
MAGATPSIENFMADGVSIPRFSAFEKNANVSSSGAWTMVVERSSYAGRWLRR